MGHQTLLFDPLPKHPSTGSGAGAFVAKSLNAFWPIYEKSAGARKQLSRKLLGACKKLGRVDLAICCFDYLYPENAAALKAATGCRLALWYPDSIANFGKHAFLNAPYDALFFKDPYIVRRLSAMVNRPVYYLPEAYEPLQFEKKDLALYPEAQYECDICIAGNLYPYRISFFEQLVDYHVRIWGNPAPRWADDSQIRHMVQNRYLAGKEKIAAFRAARIVLNNLHPAEIESVNVRAFEIAGARGFQMIDERACLPELFEVGREIVQFSSIRELRGKIDHYLSAPVERAQIAQAAEMRARTEHTYESRLSFLIRKSMFGGLFGDLDD